MTNLITKLEWDSGFFGFGVGRINLTNSFLSVADRILNEMDEKQIALLYVFCDQEISISSSEKEKFFQFLKGKLVDTKVVFSKTIDNDILYQFPSGIVEFEGVSATAELYELALQSGVWSRFKLDPNLPPDAYERLYRLWIDNSVNGVMADKIYIYKDEFGLIKAMVTLSLKPEEASVGLIAVDQSCQGLGLGNKLMLAAEWLSWISKRQKITVATQLNNLGACKFYKRCDYQEESRTEVYHCWR
jgi:dTDP-4-amino-4,6-dideoxy-D-galactose acyltransferase